MQITLTNTLTRRKEQFEPADPARVTMYVCGPTVYSHPHIGNARPPVVFDVLFRLLRHRYGDDAVVYARNYTDIDDKIIAAANKAGVAIEAITEKFVGVYEADMGALGVLEPTLKPRATAHVDDMIKLIQELLDQGLAYRGEHGVWFSVPHAQVHAGLEYGKLSGRTMDDSVEETAELEYDKQGIRDFALWKAAKPGEPAWNAPFGRGRPGWHIECSAMIESVLGGTIDIHGGGIDLMFPHHENEIAQSESAHHRQLARVWMHNGFLTMDREKMSKSIGNIVTVRELLDRGVYGETIRWALLSAHYRSSLDFTDELLKQSKASLDRLYQTLRDAKAMALVPWFPSELRAIEADVNFTLKEFMAALFDDLDTPRAMKAMFAISDDLRRVRNRLVHSEATPVYEVRRPLMALLQAGRMLGVLGADPDDWFTLKMPFLDSKAQFYSHAVSAADDTAEINALVAERTEARKAKNFAESDRLRAVLAARGVEVMDGPSGSTWRRKT